MSQPEKYKMLGEALGKVKNKLFPLCKFWASASTNGFWQGGQINCARTVGACSPQHAVMHLRSMVLYIVIPQDPPTELWVHSDTKISDFGYMPLHVSRQRGIVCSSAAIENE